LRGLEPVFRKKTTDSFFAPFLPVLLSCPIAKPERAKRNFPLRPFLFERPHPALDGTASCRSRTSLQINDFFAQYADCNNCSDFHFSCCNRQPTLLYYKAWVASPGCEAGQAFSVPRNK
jgi:hypothetical protein